MKKRQFKGGAQPRTFYDRKVRTPGHSRVVAMGKVIPQDWRYVRIWMLEKTMNTRTIRIEKLLGAEINTHTNKNDKKNRQNTSRSRRTRSHEPSSC